MTGSDSIGTTKRARAHDAIDDLVARHQPVTFAAVARAAHVSRSLCYTDPELCSAIELHRARPSDQKLTAASETSVRADLEHARTQLRQLDHDNQLLRRRLEQNLGDDLDHRLTQPHGARLEELEQRALQLSVENTDLRRQLDQAEATLEEHRDSLDAARTMNRELMARINRAR